MFVIETLKDLHIEWGRKMKTWSGSMRLLFSKESMWGSLWKELMFKVDGSSMVTFD